MEAGKKIVLLGQFGVGKTSLMRRFVKDEFATDYKPTLGVQIKKKVLVLPSGNEISMIIWDLEGFSSVSKTRSSYLLGSHAFIYVFDLTRPVTYYNLDDEIRFLEQHYPNIFLTIVANKLDSKDPSSITNYLKEKNIEVSHIVSAKTGEGVSALFMETGKNITQYG